MLLLLLLLLICVHVPDSVILKLSGVSKGQTGLWERLHPACIFSECFARNVVSSRVSDVVSCQLAFSDFFFSPLPSADFEQSEVMEYIGMIMSNRVD